MHDQPDLDRETHPLRVAVAAAGTAGHVLPALAVARKLREQGAAVVVIGGDRAEVKLVERAGFTLVQVPAGGLDRRNPLRAASGLGRSLLGVILALRALRRSRAEVVLAAGGYIAGIVGAAALLLRLPLVLTEADSHLGLANRLLARHARQLCLAFPIAGLEHRRHLVTGRPLPAAPLARERARKLMGLEQRDRLLVAFGGSLGSRTINSAVLGARELLGAAGVRVLHIAGSREYGQLAQALGGRAQAPGYELTELLDPQQLAVALSAADLVLCRSGGSVLEVAAHGAPMVLVPYPHAAADHQRANAAALAAAGAAIVIEDSQLDAERLVASVLELLDDPRRLQAMSAAARALGSEDAAAMIAREVLRAAGRGGARG